LVVSFIRRETAMKRKIVAISVLVLVLGPAVPAAAAPNPNPVAPSHTGTACANVLANNPQAGEAAPSLTVIFRGKDLARMPANGRPVSPQCAA
jgi:hypothetical protein